MCYWIIGDSPEFLGLSDGWADDEVGGVVGDAVDSGVISPDIAASILRMRSV